MTASRIFSSQNRWSAPGQHKCYKTPSRAKHVPISNAQKARRPSLAIYFSSRFLLQRRLLRSQSLRRLRPPSEAAYLPRPPSSATSAQRPYPLDDQRRLPPSDLHRRLLPASGTSSAALVACGLPSSTSCRPPAPPPICIGNV
ncbi:uncharacterized protein LOC122009209 isoform X2 [Zingiber officinale]|uniref:uncharacterized protein LOC122009209 isoform X2 n=1 Tax=Zingiber officinale TaxID=94328 RepID=UPI001C4CD6D2|nr:uncharacterized protein LOC122009209 isoform X2 [Zingiber officinale]